MWAVVRRSVAWRTDGMSAPRLDRAQIVERLAPVVPPDLLHDLLDIVEPAAQAAIERSKTARETREAEAGGDGPDGD